MTNDNNDRLFGDNSDDTPLDSSANESPKKDDSTDPFDNLESLRLSQDFSDQAPVKPVFTTIPVRKPNRQEFIRVRPGEDWRFETGLFKDEESNEFYMLTPALWDELPGDVKPTCLVTVINRTSPVPFLWPLTLPGPDGRPNRWHESAMDAARRAEQCWLKVVSDMRAGCYVPHEAMSNLAEPAWPDDLTLADLLKLAFRNRFIEDANHPVMQRLRGAI